MTRFFGIMHKFKINDHLILTNRYRGFFLGDQFVIPGTNEVKQIGLSLDDYDKWNATGLKFTIKGLSKTKHCFS